jgi:hypothetical protein
MSTTYPTWISLGMIPALGGRLLAIETRHSTFINKNASLSLLQSVFYLSGVYASQPRHKLRRYWNRNNMLQEAKHVRDKKGND